jgi:hypothetical protein
VLRFLGWSCGWLLRIRVGDFQRIVGELRKLGIAVSPSTVRRMLLNAGLEPAPRRSGPTWREFLGQQAAGILACDFFSAPRGAV